MKAPYKRKSDFFQTEEGIEIEQSLREMVDDDRYQTDSSYSTNTTLYPDNEIPFVNKHKEFLLAHPTTDAQQYLSNLRLMTRFR